MHAKRLRFCSGQTMSSGTKPRRLFPTTAPTSYVLLPVRAGRARGTRPFSTCFAPNDKCTKRLHIREPFLPRIGVACLLRPFSTSDRRKLPQSSRSTMSSATSGTLCGCAALEIWTGPSKDFFGGEASRLRILYTPESDMIRPAVRLAFAAGSDHVTSAILIAAEE